MRILAADDDRISLRLLDAALTAAGHEVILARDGPEAIAAFGRDPPPQIAVLDWNMPGADGVEVCRWVRSRPDAGYVYVILLTSRGAPPDRVEGFDAGADDFVVKPFQFDELQARIRVGARLVASQVALDAANERLREQAAHDALTGLLNRGAILSHLERDLASAVRVGGDVAVAMVDVDHFKRVNDGFGHPAGDEVLREVSRRMASTLRPSDAIGRCGGEEFLVVMSATDAAGAALVAERLRVSIRQEPIQVDGAAHQITCSFGVAVSPGGSAAAERLIAAADAALYTAKRSGRDRVEIASDVAPPAAPAVLNEAR